MGLAHLVPILLLCAQAFAAMEVEQSSSYNLALAPSLLGAPNSCGAPVRAPAEGDIFSVADARIVSLVPQAGNATSDLSNVSALWSWSADFPSVASFSFRDENRCPAGEIRYFAPSRPSLSGRLAYSYGNSTVEIPPSSIGPSPAPLNLSQSKLAAADFSQPFARLSLSLDATISISYSFSKSGYSYQCASQGGYTGCGCVGEYSHGTRAFSREVSHNRDFSVETGPDSLLWLNPPLSSRLSGNESAEVALFARRLPASIAVVSGGTEIASFSPYSFSLRTGECGEEIAEREFSPAQAPSAGAFISTSAPISPYQLVEKNASYVPFYFKFPWRASAGKANVTINSEDAFGHHQAFSRGFFVREPAPLSSEDGAAVGGAMVERAASESETSASFPAHAQEGAFPDLSVLAVAFALPIALAAAALCRRMGLA